MKLSIVRTDKKNISHLTVKSIEWFLERIKTDTKAEDIGKFRHYIARFGDTGQYEDNVPMAMIHPLVEMTKTENGNLEITTFNSLTIDTFCKAAYEVALGAYSGVLPKPIERQTVTARSSFRMTLDESPYYNSQATPMMVQIVRNDLMPTDESGSEQREMDYRGGVAAL